MSPRAGRLGRLSVLIPLVFAFAACSGDNGPSEPSDDPPDDDPPDDVQLVTLEVTARLDRAFEEIGRELGWEGVGVPDALVTVRRLGAQSRDSIRTGTDGRAVFEELLEGNYTISAIRRLEAAERERLSEEHAELAVLGGGTTAFLQPTSETRTLDIRGGKRGSIVISEVYNRVLEGSYYYAHYMELYNNADSTVYLDGLLVGNGWDRSVNGGNWPCTDFDHLRLDPEGLWAKFIFRIPGGGHSYPLAPGETAVLATDAIDHGEFVENGPDLSRADFEFIGRNDVDNPSVPNLTSIGPSVDNIRHGIIFQSIRGVPFVARFVDLDALPRETVVIGSQERDYVRLPREDLIDVAQFIWFGGSIPVCDQIVHPTIDRAPHAIDTDDLESIQRRVLFEEADGRAVLQDTDTSDRDFENTARTPGEPGR